ncbi:MAG: hypothetical protein FJW38_28935 [Acidobacteria bacterium]|nr:hypothetical protein [Acidobacteriota bacterium]
MKFVADENFPGAALRLLRRSGFDVASIAEAHPGIPDTEVLALASSEGRTLLTFDKDFGELAFRRGLPASCGVILFRIGLLGPAESAELALATLQSGVEWAGHFCVVNNRKIRIKPLRPYFEPKR